MSGQRRDFGFKTRSDAEVEADFMKPSENFLTGNDVTVYAFASLDLKIDGSTVVEISAGMYGNANDAAFNYLTDFGPTGPDKGKGGKCFFLPPGYKGEKPDGYFFFQPRLTDLGDDARPRRCRHRRQGRPMVQGTLESLFSGQRPA